MLSWLLADLTPLPSLFDLLSPALTTSSIFPHGCSCKSKLVCSLGACTSCLFSSKQSGTRHCAWYAGSRMTAAGITVEWLRNWYRVKLASQVHLTHKWPHTLYLIYKNLTETSMTFHTLSAWLANDNWIIPPSQTGPLILISSAKSTY